MVWIPSKKVVSKVAISGDEGLSCGSPNINISLSSHFLSLEINIFSRGWEVTECLKTGKRQLKWGTEYQEEVSLIHLIKCSTNHYVSKKMVAQKIEMHSMVQQTQTGQTPHFIKQNMHKNQDGQFSSLTFILYFSSRSALQIIQ